MHHQRVKMPETEVDMGRKMIYRQYIKPLIDCVLGLLGLVCLSWLFALIAVAIYVDDPGPILYKQRRVGRKKNGEITYFYIYKFRTMKVGAPELPTHLLENPERWITCVGKILRRTSLDELPQLWNIAVFRNLSIVGPRPALWSQDDLVAEREKYGANDVMPGLTGWAQINGRDELGIQEKARLDGYYVQHLNFAMDARCFFGTFGTVARQEGVVEGGNGKVTK